MAGLVTPGLKNLPALQAPAFRRGVRDGYEPCVLPIELYNAVGWPSKKSARWRTFTQPSDIMDENPNQQTVLGRISGVLVVFRASAPGCPRNFAPQPGQLQGRDESPNGAANS